MRVYIALKPASVEHIVSNMWSGGSEEFGSEIPEVPIAGFQRIYRMVHRLERLIALKCVDCRWWLGFERRIPYVTA
jgi:hypothetical protein